MLGERGIAVTWNGAAVDFNSPDAHPPYVTVALDASERTIAAMMKAGPDGRSFLDHVRARHRRLLDAAEAAKPPDVTHDQWQTAVDGLRVFLLAGWGEEAARLGWPCDELYRVPPLWGRLDLCGVGLLIGDCEVTDITAEAIRIKTASGSSQSFRRQPEPDFGLVYAERVKFLSRDVDEAEARARSFEFAVNACRVHASLSLEAAKQVVMAAIKRSASR